VGVRWEHNVEHFLSPIWAQEMFYIVSLLLLCQRTKKLKTWALRLPSRFIFKPLYYTIGLQVFKENSRQVELGCRTAAQTKVCRTASVTDIPQYGVCLPQKACLGSQPPLG
jgi:hypothetical protein